MGLFDKMRVGDIIAIRYQVGGRQTQWHMVTHWSESSCSMEAITNLDVAMEVTQQPPVLNWNGGYPFWEDQLAIQGACVCPEGGVTRDCPRHAYAYDWIGQDPWKDHFAPSQWTAVIGDGQTSE